MITKTLRLFLSLTILYGRFFLFSPILLGFVCIFNAQIQIPLKRDLRGTYLAER